MSTPRLTTAVAATAAVAATSWLAGCDTAARVGTMAGPVGPTSATVHTRLLDLGTVTTRGGHNRPVVFHRRMLELRVQPHCKSGGDCEGTYVATLTYRFEPRRTLVHIDYAPHVDFEPARGALVIVEDQSVETDDVDPHQVSVSYTPQVLTGPADPADPRSRTGPHHFIEIHLRAYGDGSARIRWTSLQDQLTCTTPVIEQDRVPHLVPGQQVSESPADLARGGIVGDVISSSLCHR